MDLGTILGGLLGVLIVMGTIVELTHGDVMSFYSGEATLLVVVGSASATLLSVPLKDFMQMPRVIMKLLFCKDLALDKIINELVDLATIARRDGMLALEGEMQKGIDPFLSKGLQMVIDGQKADEVEATLRIEAHAASERHTVGKKIFAIMGNYAPAFGLTATIMAQIIMFKQMGGDMSAMGNSLAIALLGTLYGALFANAVCLPMADKLGIRAAQEKLQKELYIQGVIAIATDVSPTVLKTKLAAFLDRKTAAKMQG